MASLSVVVITRDEEENLGACLDTVPFADEIVVVDDGSTDGTLEVARRYSARIFERSLDRFGRQKQFAIEQATSEWILVLDADERVTPELARSIQNVVEGDGDPDGYRLRRRTWLFSEPVTCTGWYKYAHLRLFRRGAARYVDRRVHEFPELHEPSRCGRLSGDLDHFTYADLDEYREKLDRYSRLAASDWYDMGRRVNLLTAPWWLIAVPAAAFIREFLVQGGWRCGRVGWRIASMARESALLTGRYLRRITTGQLALAP